MEPCPQRDSSVPNERVCPWWLAYAFDQPLRRLIHKPEKILDGLVLPGQTVLDIGCGMGFFSLGMARMVGEKGRVISVDLQKKMLDVLGRRAERAGLRSRIHLHQCQPDRIGISEQVDFALSFWMVHEVPDKRAFLAEVHSFLKPGAHYLLVEPKIHVAAPAFQRTVEIACASGMKPCLEAGIRLSRSVLLLKIAAVSAMLQPGGAPA
jgi:ubiquinone/menaquinone biosynthesis C-methylase UbiE